MFTREFFRLKANSSLPFLLSQLNTNLSFLGITLTFLVGLNFYAFNFFRKYAFFRATKNSKPIYARLGASILLFLIFFFFLPEVNVNANFKESVLPVTTKTEVIKIKDDVKADSSIAFISPVNGYLSTYFSSRHLGIDIPNPLGQPILAAEGGEVVVAGWSNVGYGNMISIRHKLGFETVYAHLSKISVRIGKIVKQGEIIGLVGSTGNSTGNHLHLEIHNFGRSVNPLSYINP